MQAEANHVTVYFLALKVIDGICPRFTQCGYDRDDVMVAGQSNWANEMS
jgi:hypothetical protein